MSTQIISVLSTFFVVSSILTGIDAYAYGDYGGDSGAGGGGSNSGFSLGISDTQQRRAAERFDILDWVRHNDSLIAAQNSKYGYSKGGGSHVFNDFVLTYSQDSGTVTRGPNLGTDTRAFGRIQYLLDNLFTEGDRKRSLNIDLGVEGYLSQTTAFAAASGVNQQSHAYNETGGALLLRPFGRSSQDSSLLVKGGYMNMSETGLWTNTTNQVSLYGYYLGAEAKLYLLPFLGLKGEFDATLQQPSTVLQAQWKMQRFTYGAFIEIYLLNIGAYFISTEMDMLPNSGAAEAQEFYSGVGFLGTLYF